MFVCRLMIFRDLYKAEVSIDDKKIPLSLIYFVYNAINLKSIGNSIGILRMDDNNKDCTFLS